MRYELIKVCGLREADNLRAVAALGVDLLGLIFAPQSPRCVGAVPLRVALSPRQRLVGVFVDQPLDFIVRQVERWGLGAVQLHGRETPEQLRCLRERLEAGKPAPPDVVDRGGESRRPPCRAPYEGASTLRAAKDAWRRRRPALLKAISVRQASDVDQWRAYAEVADLLLFDTKTEVAGGSGRKFPWAALERYDGALPFLLSGGIGPDDAERLAAFSHPQCVGLDLNSRFETAPGRKNVEALRGLLAALHPSN